MNICKVVQFLLVLLTARICSSLYCSFSSGTLDCHETGLTSFPHGAWRVEEVEEIIVDINDIEDIDEDLGTLYPKLNKISMRLNELPELDLGALLSFNECFGLVCRRLELDVTANPFTEVVPPADNQQVESLVRLDMVRSMIESLPVDVFEGAPNLNMLDLSDSLTKIRLPSDRPFLKHRRLQTLFLRGSDASAITSTTFSELPSLSILDLESSGIHELSAGVFGNLTSLLSLKLGNNYITHIQVEIFSRGQALALIDLSENPLQRINTQVLTFGYNGILKIYHTPMVRKGAPEHLIEWGKKKNLEIKVWINS